MRLLLTTVNPDLSLSFSRYLTKEGIKHNLEEAKSTDWGDPSYGELNYRIWIEDEDDYPKASKLWETYQQNPHELPPPQPAKIPSFSAPNIKNSATFKPILTKLIIAFTAFIFLISGLLAYPFQLQEATSAYYIPSPVERNFLYDYPQKVSLINKLIDLYGLQPPTPETSEEEQNFYSLIARTPMWEGIYDPLIHYFHNQPYQNELDVPLFEKIREGEIWRLVTPIFLHANFIHILFNMMVLFVLGKEMERLISAWKYLLFILITAVITNTTQYLLSGFSFLGFSGVICAMLGFIYARLRFAPWEGYQLEKNGFRFMMSFILAMGALSIVAFIADIAGHRLFETPIANGAHLSGLLSGYLIGKTKWARAA